MKLWWPKRWFNRLLVVVGLFGLCGHASLTLYLAWHELHYPMHWTFTVLAPLCCLAWGLIPKLQLQTESPTKIHTFKC